MKKVLIIGATSAIAQESAKLFAARGDALFLVGRNSDQLTAITEDLSVRGATLVQHECVDLNEIDRHKPLIETAITALDGLDTVLIAYGTLPDQQVCAHATEQMLQALNTNAISVMSLLTLLANAFEQRGSGTIAVISSVAGDRGRQSNYVYGAAKAAVSTFMSGLRNRLQPQGIQVLTIKPGFVDTPMTKAFDKGLLWVKPEVIAKGIMAAIDKGKDVVYLPWFWRYIMLIICAIPERLFKKLKL
ncbi:MAG: SDR family oxidoreductase [Gammaproteobacteria bacterium]|nr:SDR family oxidoreductase [Gammaproteobacteria bacterium]